MAPHGPAPRHGGGRRGAGAAQSCRHWHQMETGTRSQWRHAPPNGDWGRARLWWRGGTSTSGTMTLAFPKTFPLAAGREDAENRLSINSQSFLPGPSCRCLLTSTVLANSDTAIWGQTWTQQYILLKKLKFDEESPSRHLSLHFQYIATILWARCSLISSRYCSQQRQIWEDFVQVMSRALCWRERFEIGSNLPTIILANAFQTVGLPKIPKEFFWNLQRSLLKLCQIA